MVDGIAAMGHGWSIVRIDLQRLLVASLSQVLTTCWACTLRSRPASNSRRGKLVRHARTLWTPVVPAPPARPHCTLAVSREVGETLLSLCLEPLSLADRCRVGQGTDLASPNPAAHLPSPHSASSCIGSLDEHTEANTLPACLCIIYLGKAKVMGLFRSSSGASFAAGHPLVINTIETLRWRNKKRAVSNRQRVESTKLLMLSGWKLNGWCLVEENTNLACMLSGQGGGWWMASGVWMTWLKEMLEK